MSLNSLARSARKNGGGSDSGGEEGEAEETEEGWGGGGQRKGWEKGRRGREVDSYQLWLHHSA